MKILVAYYSRSGNTRKVALIVAEALRTRGAVVTREEIVDLKPRGGVLGLLGAGVNALFKSATRIATPRADVADFDLVLVGTPVWGWTAAPAALAYCRAATSRVKRAAFFCTMIGVGARGTFSAMNQAMSEEPVATLALTGRQLRDQTALETYVSQLADRLCR